MLQIKEKREMKIQCTRVELDIEGLLVQDQGWGREGWKRVTHFTNLGGSYLSRKYTTNIDMNCSTLLSN